jgi:predicted CoA-binding protein
MPSPHESFWLHPRYAVVGHSAKAPFPRLSYAALKARGKTVFAVDPEADTIDGDRAYHALSELPEKVDGVLVEVPRDETLTWIRAAADAGVPRAWIHMNRDTPEALAEAKARGVEVCTGTCAVQYLTDGFDVHAVHRGLRKLLGRW